MARTLTRTRPGDLAGPAEYGDLTKLGIKLRPLDRQLEGEGSSSQFSAKWPDTVELLGRELRLLEAERVVLMIDLREQDFRLDGFPRGGRAPNSPVVMLAFYSALHEVELRYEGATYDKFRDNVRAIAKSLDALRSVDRYGVSGSGQQYAGWKQLEAGSVGEGDANRGRELVEAAGGSVRAALMLAHPDHGGEADDFRHVIAYRDSSS